MLTRLHLVHCMGPHCQRCREPELGKNFRKALARMQGCTDVDFDCPIHPWGYVPDPHRPVQHSVLTRVIETEGPRLWAELHTYQPANPTEATAWLANFAKRIPCGQCRAEYETFSKSNPPNLSSPSDFFAWTAQLHNHVNDKLGKPQFTLEEARKKWLPAK